MTLSQIIAKHSDALADKENEGRAALVADCKRRDNELGLFAGESLYDARRKF